MNETISPILYSVLQGYFSVLVFFGFTASIFIHKREGVLIHDYDGSPTFG